MNNFAMLFSTHLPAMLRVLVKNDKVKLLDESEKVKEAYFFTKTILNLAFKLILCVK